MILIALTSPAKSSAGNDLACFAEDAAQTLIKKVVKAETEVVYQKKEITVLKQTVEELTLARDDSVNLNITYTQMIEILEDEITLKENDVGLADTRSELWKDEADKCGKALVRCRNGPWFLSKRFLIPLTFIAGVYTGSSMR